jgi:hypothetical protein
MKRFRRKGRFIRGRRKIVWRHSAFDFGALLDQYKDDPAKTRILQILLYVRSGQSHKQVSMALKVDPKEIRKILSGYRERFGLASLLNLDVRVPANFDPTITKWVGESRKNLARVLSAEGKAMEELAEEINVEDYALQAWALRHCIEGGNP